MNFPMFDNTHDFGIPEHKPGQNDPKDKKQTNHTTVDFGASDIGDTIQELPKTVGDLFKGGVKLTDAVVELADSIVQALPEAVESVGDLLGLIVQGSVTSLEYISLHPKVVQWIVIGLAAGWFVKRNPLFLREK